MAAKGRRAVGYARVSTPAQDRPRDGLRRQVDAIGDYCGDRGWALVEVAEDVASGSVPFSQRPGGVRVLELLTAGEVTAIVCEAPDRFSRAAGDEALAAGLPLHWTSSLVAELEQAILELVREYVRDEFGLDHDELHRAAEAWKAGAAADAAAA